MTRDEERRLEVLAMFAELSPRGELEAELYRRHLRHNAAKCRYRQTPKGKACAARHRPKTYAKLRSDPVKWKAYCARVLERRKERIAEDPRVLEAMRAYWRAYNKKRRAQQRAQAQAAE